MKPKKPFCWVLVPTDNKVQQLTSFWKAVAHLANEGKDVMCHMPSKDTLCMLEEKKVSCDELVIIGVEDWEHDHNVHFLMNWAKHKNIGVRIMDDTVWSEVDNRAKQPNKRSSLAR